MKASLQLLGIGLLVAVGLSQPPITVQVCQDRNAAYCSAPAPSCCAGHQQAQAPSGCSGCCVEIPSPAAGFTVPAIVRVSDPVLIALTDLGAWTEPAVEGGDTSGRNRLPSFEEPPLHTLGVRLALHRARLL